MVDDVRAVSHAAVVGRLDAVAVWVEEKRPVVAVVVDRARAGLPVARKAPLGARTPERVDRVGRARDEPHVQASRHGPGRVGLRDAEVVPLVVVLTRVGEAVTERREHALVEAAAGRAIGDPNRDVVEHGYLRAVGAFGFAVRFGCPFDFVFGAGPDEARARRGPSLPRNATSIPFSEK